MTAVAVIDANQKALTHACLPRTYCPRRRGVVFCITDAGAAGERFVGAGPANAAYPTESVTFAPQPYYLNYLNYLKPLKAESPRGGVGPQQLSELQDISSLSILARLLGTQLHPGAPDSEAIDIGVALIASVCESNWRPEMRANLVVGAKLDCFLHGSDTGAVRA